MKKRKRKVSSSIFVILVLAALFVAARRMAYILYPLKYEEYIKKYANQYNIDPYVVAAMIKTESNFNVEANSHKDARGLMQITGETGKWIASKMKIENYEEKMLYDPETNIKMGCWYINNLREEFGDNLDLILASYNAGRGRVNNWLENKQYSLDGKKLDYIPYEETNKYVKKIEANYNIYKFLYKNKLNIS
ncbi:MAG: lytic transglycosylase domain-containing protein [Clostridiales bacterium]|uniref:lytic transglycosylase domain-containing protein n=1 Tax=Clostridium sp. N3C TaxID=1776758 RepID=UPI00092DEFC0|nr:lytic transglycosylase domain-containing protein [Clostridium sp. N3C]NLZ48510.1 lytic transglycosylase domain-containing protein [Clostridiales bacterium]SCN21713.1 Soluble lytic murein transglycosylase precursor [Clostridium sp. N3C]